MELRLKLVLVVLLGACSITCFPSRPLSDRPSELTWQDWLLVDSQNQLQNESDRRITPKSVFIAPKLGQRNNTLPDCADGYRADSMGRCIKFVKVDEAAHLNFLLSRLNEMYAANSEEDIEESDESEPTAGPLQFNIPLGQSEDDEPNDSQEEVKESASVDVLAPANGQFDDKFNVKRQPETKPIENPKLNNEQVEYATETDDGYDYVDENTEETETTTQTEIPTELTTEYETTTITTTEEIRETTEVPTNKKQNEPDDELKALFFKIPTTNIPTTKNTSQLRNTTPKSLVESNEDIQADSQHVVEEVTAFHNEKLPLIQEDSSYLHSESLPLIIREESPIRYKEHHPEHIRSPTLKFPPASHNSEEHMVRFPSETNVREEYPADVKPHYGPIIHHRPHELSSEQVQEIFKQYIHRHAAYPERPQIPPERIYNHRNRDRNEDLWSLTPTIKEDKPLIVRFDRYPQPYYSSQGAHPPQKHALPHQEVKFFDEDTRREYPTSYGRKRRRGNFR